MNTSTMRTSAPPVPSHTSPSTSYSSLAPLSPDQPAAEHYETCLRRRLALVTAMTAQAAAPGRSPIARREAARLATWALGMAAALLAAWTDDLQFTGADYGDWAVQTAEAIGDGLALAHATLTRVVAELPVAVAPLARTSVPSSRKAGAA